MKTQNYLLRFLFVAVFLHLFPDAGAQTDLIRNYKWRYQAYRAKQWNISGSGFANGQREIVGSAKYPYNNQGITIPVNYGYLKLINTENRQEEKNANGRMFFSAGSTSYRQPNYDFQVSYSANRTVRSYGAENRFHYQYFSAGAGYGNLIRLGNTVDGYFHSGNFNVEYRLGSGKGRLELVSDMVFSLFWLQDMKSKGVIRAFSEEQAEGLAQAITGVRNRRIMDYRFRMAGLVNSLDTFFRKSGLLLDSGALYFTTLYDHFLYANNFTRFHGKRFTWYTGVGLSGTGSNTVNNYTGPDKNSVTSALGAVTPVLGIEWRTEKAISQYRQKGFFISADMHAEYRLQSLRNKVRSGAIYTESNIWNHRPVPVFRLNSGIALSWYPDTRSWLSFSPGAVAFFSYDQKGFDGIENNLNYSAGLYIPFAFYRWISPNLSYSVRYNAFAGYSEESWDQMTARFTNKMYIINNNFSIGLQYNIF